MLELNNLDKAKMALALHFQLSRCPYSSRNVGGSATPEARIAAEACAWSWGSGSKSAEIYFSVLYARSTPLSSAFPFPVTLYLSPDLRSP